MMIKPMPGKNRSKVGIDVVEKIISLKEVDQEFLTNKTILAYLGGVSKEYIKDLREAGILPYGRGYSSHTWHTVLQVFWSSLSLTYLTSGTSCH